MDEKEIGLYLFWQINNRCKKIAEQYGDTSIGVMTQMVSDRFDLVNTNDLHDTVKALMDGLVGSRHITKVKGRFYPVSPSMKTTTMLITEAQWQEMSK